MTEKGIRQEAFYLKSEGLTLRVFVAIPPHGAKPFPSVQIHHAGGGYETIYEHMAMDLAGRGMVGITLIHRGYPGSEGEMEYGKGEVRDIGNLAEEMRARSYIDPDKMGIMGYSRGAHNAILAIEATDYFKAGALWSVPVDMVDHVAVNPWVADMFGGTPDEVPEEYRIRSSIYFVERINCPLLILHGEDDHVIPVRHALRLARELEKHGKPFEMKIVPREWHIWTTPGFNTNWRLTVDFFRRHLQTSA